MTSLDLSAASSDRASLIIVCGLPGAGKTTTATRMAAERRGVRLCPDDWFDALDLDLWDQTRRTAVEQLQWSFGRELLAAGVTVVVEWGTWGRDERIELREQARELGARTELIMLDLPLEVLWDRVHRRGREDPRITWEDMVGWDRMIERPAADELAGYDRVEVRTA